MSRAKDVSLFCSRCATYFSSGTICPSCGEARAPLETPPEPAQPFWRAQIPPGAGTQMALAHRDGRSVLAIAWGHQPTRYDPRPVEGGVLLLDIADGSQLWRQMLGTPVEGGVTSSGDLLLVGVGRRALGGSAGAVVALDLVDGRERWRTPVKGQVPGAPAVDEPRVYAVTCDGVLTALDLNQGTLLRSRPLADAPTAVTAPPVLQWERGRVRALFVGTCEGEGRSGQLLAFDTRGRGPWMVADVPGSVRGAPVVADGRVYVTSGTTAPSQGTLVVFDARSGKELWGFSKQGDFNDPRHYYFSASPLLQGGTLYVTSHDHHLYALDAESGALRWQYDAGKGIACQPVWLRGLIVCCTKDGRVHAVDSETGERIWEFFLGGPIFATPQPFPGGVLVASDRGDLVALPWHLGQYAWAAQQSERHGDRESAALFHALADDVTFDLAARERHYATAVSLWRDSANPERAARLCEAASGIYSLDVAAAEYEHAADLLRPRSPQEAARLYLRAFRSYALAGELESARACRERVARSMHLPPLWGELFRAPIFEVGDKKELTFHIYNFGEEPVREVTLRLGGQLDGWAEVLPLQEIAPGASCEVTVSDVRPSGSELLVHLYGTAATGRFVESRQRFTLDVRASEDVVRADRDATVIMRLREGEPIPKTRIKGDGVVIVSRTQSPRPPDPAAFEWPAAASGFVTDTLDLADLRLVSEELLVEQHHSAVMLADERNVGRVGPGRYTRADFAALRALPWGRAPTWKALVLDNRPFRMAFQLGPYHTADQAPVGLRLLVRGVISPERLLALWQHAAPNSGHITARDLVVRLEPQVADVAEAWLYRHWREELSPGWHQRRELTQALQIEMHEVLEGIGVRIEEIVALELVSQPCG
jgi:outer membrane protein assembly factor BamB